MDFSKLIYAYAISGGIGSGKSAACEILQSLGYAVINCDGMAHRVLEDLSDEVIKRFGEEILLENGEIDRSELGKIVFRSKEKKVELEELLHPVIEERLWVEVQRLEMIQKVYFVEIPLLFECLERFNFAHKILVYAPKELQIERVKNRNILSEDEVLQRLNSQIDIEQKRVLADFVWENTLSKESLREKIFEWISLKKSLKSPGF